VLGAQAADLLGCRFAVSPLFELGSAIRTTHRPAGQRWHLPWLDLVTKQAAPDGLTVLQAMQPRRGYTPDFLAPTPSGPGTTVHDELDRVAQTPVEQVAHELQRCRADQSDPPAHAALSDLLADPQRARDTITRALLTCWQDLLAPHWPRVQHLLDADVAHRAQHLTDHGLTRLMQHLHPDVRYQDEAIQVDWRQPAVRQRRDVDGAGLVLMPSAFTWPQPIAVLDPPWQPTIVYPARGVAELWHRPAADPATALACCPGPHPGATPDRPRGTGRHHAPCRALQHGSQQRVPAPAGAARRRAIECTAPATARAVPANNTRNSPYPGNPAERPSTGPVDDRSVGQDCGAPADGISAVPGLLAGARPEGGSAVARRRRASVRRYRPGGGQVGGGRGSRGR